MAHPVPALGPATMIETNAVAGWPTPTDRLPGKTAATRMAGGVDTVNCVTSPRVEMSPVLLVALPRTIDTLSGGSGNAESATSNEISALTGQLDTVMSRSRFLCWPTSNENGVVSGTTVSN